MLTSITQVIEAEQHCCAFLRFELVVEPGEGPLTLAITGPAGTQQFLSGLMATSVRVD
ncbi:MAG: hypothetical protein H0T71_04490 [Acidobacteria bacterium]|nr:hypothetical protein [Acidobacteriota bacterium]